MGSPGRATFRTLGEEKFAAMVKMRGLCLLSAAKGQRITPLRQRPYLVGEAIQEIAADREIINAVFEILETEKMLHGDVVLTVIPPDKDGLRKRLLAAEEPAQVQPPPLQSAS